MAYMSGKNTEHVYAKSELKTKASKSNGRFVNTVWYNAFYSAFAHLLCL